MKRLLLVPVLWVGELLSSSKPYVAPSIRWKEEFVGWLFLVLYVLIPLIGLAIRRELNPPRPATDGWNQARPVNKWLRR